jgi:nicotinamide riboside kinase
VITGTESSGKSTLVAQLSERLGWPSVPESARLLVDELGRGLEFSDLPRLVAGYRARRTRALRLARRRVAPGIILDTDLYSTWTYAQHYMGSVPEWLKRSARRGAADLYLFCKPDIPLVPDPGQRGSEADRDAVNRALSTLLRDERGGVLAVSGTEAQRVGLAIKAISKLAGAGLFEGRRAETGGAKRRNTGTAVKRSRRSGKSPEG